MSSASPEDRPTRRPGVRADMNVTPLVDIVLVLLIIFMVMTPQMEAGASVALPAATTADAEKGSTLEPITVTLTKDGALYLDRDQLPREALLARLKALRDAKPDRKLVLKADQAVPYEKVRSLFQACQSLAFPGISLQVIDKAKRAEGGAHGV